jgi:hypothetical protein
MRITLIILLIAGVLFIVLQAFTAVSTARTEQQPYTVLQQLGELEIRHYPAALMATVESPDTSFRGSSNASFRRLAGYIFGGNEQAKSIPMTAPVHMEQAPAGSRMRFVMPASFTADSMPLPNDPGVRMDATEEEHVAALRFGGFGSEDRIAEHRAQLLAACATEGLEVLGGVRYLGYDPPWQMVGRRNEVVVRVKWPR